MKARITKIFVDECRSVKTEVILEDPSDVPKAYDYGEQTEAEHKNVVRGIGPDGKDT